MTGEYNIPNISQYAGESNPYDNLWYLSLEIGRSLIFDVQRIGTGIGSSTKDLLEKHASILEDISKLDVMTREFLYNESYFYKNNFQQNENIMLMDMEKRSCSKMSYQSQLVSKNFLIATLGEANGIGEYNRRCLLCQEAKRFNETFLSQCIDYLWGKNELYNEEMKKFFVEIFHDTFEDIEDEDTIQSIILDVQLMLDCKEFNYNFYNGIN